MSKVQPIVAPEIARDLDVIRGGEPSGLPPRKKRRWLSGLLLLIAVAGAAAAYELRERGPVAPAVGVVAVGLREIGLPEVKLAATGYLVPRRQITVSSRVQGKIIEMPVEENQKVEAGALLARIENREQEAHLRLSEAEHADGKTRYARAQSLHELGAIATAELETARTALDVAVARLDLAHVAIEQTQIRAPIDGTVIRKLRDVGEFLTIGVTAQGEPGTAVATLADLGEMFVSLEINETDISDLGKGDIALVAVEALRDKRYMAEITDIAAMADRQKGMVPVKVRLRAPGPELLPEMTARVTFLEAEPERPVEVLRALPDTAIARRGEETFVFVLEDGTVQAVPVSVSPDRDGFVALLEGPAEGAYVVDNPPAALKSGEAIRVESP